MKEEQAREAAKQTMIASLMQNPQNLDDVFNTLWNAGVEYANRWTYCEDALPKKFLFDRFLVTLANNSVFEATFNGNSFHPSVDGHFHATNPVIAWRELPDPANR